MRDVLNQENRQKKILGEGSVEFRGNRIMAYLWNKERIITLNNYE
jgi:hypothetical protein